MVNVDMFILLATKSYFVIGVRRVGIFLTTCITSLLRMTSSAFMLSRPSVLSVNLFLYHPTPGSYTTKMPHFPEAPAETSDMMELPTREREHDEPNDQRPHPPATNNVERASRLRIQTRRRRYLALNPSYFDGSNLEHAGR